MTKPSTKMHLIDVDDPIECFTDLIPRCHIVIHKAAWVYSVNNDLANPRNLEAELGMNSLSHCVECLLNPPRLDRDKRQYTYAIVERAEEKEEAA